MAFGSFTPTSCEHPRPYPVWVPGMFYKDDVFNPRALWSSPEGWNPDALWQLPAALGAAWPPMPSMPVDVARARDDVDVDAAFMQAAALGSTRLGYIAN